MSPKVVKIEADEEEAKLTKKLMEEMELRTLMRQDRLMKEANSKDAMTEKQRKVISALDQENHELVSNLRVMQTERRCREDSLQARHVAKLFGQGDTLELEVAREKKYIADLEEQVRLTTLQLEQQRRDAKRTYAGSDFQLVEENRRRDRLLESWKSRLHADQVHLSVLTKENADLRQRIALQLKSKSRFNELFEQLIHQLNRGKQLLIQIVEQSQALSKKRNEVSRKIQALKDKDAVDLRKRQEEMQDLEMKLTEDTTTQIFRQKVLKSRTKLSDSKKATKTALLQQQALEHELSELERTLAMVRKDTGLEVTQDICELLGKQEADNYSLFCYNNELRHQLQALTDSTMDLMRKVDEEQEHANEKEDEQERIKNTLEKKLASLETTATDLNEQVNASFRSFDRLLSKIRTLFDMASCDTWPLEQLLGDNTEVTDFNYRLYMGLLETRLVQLLTAYSQEQAVDYGPLLSKLSTFTTPRKSGPLVTIVTDRKILTRPCPECAESKARRQYSSVYMQHTDHVKF